MNWLIYRHELSILQFKFFFLTNLNLGGGCHVALDRTSVYFKFEVTRRGPHMSSSATGLYSSCGDVVFVVWCDWLRAVYFLSVWVSCSLFIVVGDCCVSYSHSCPGWRRGSVPTRSSRPVYPPIVWLVVVWECGSLCCVWVINLVNFTLSMYKRV